MKKQYYHELNLLNLFEKKMKRTPYFCLIFPILLFAGYGDFSPGYSGYPNYQERITHVWTNLCRTSPAAFRDTLIVPVCTGSQSILTAYPAVDPLYWNLNLNRASRFHSVDMAINNCWGHNSCDGTTPATRLGTFYPGISWWGENIAAGNSASLATLRQWIIEGTTCPPPADGSGSDGHRANIMNSNYHELGVGYAYNSAAMYDHYWTQDFAGNASAYADRCLVSGSHDFSLATNKASFLLNYFDGTGKAPSVKSVVVGGVSNAMTLWMGAPSRGTYRVDLAKGSACRNYYFAFVDGNSTACRYPEAGVLVTFGEGGCTNDYLPPESTSVEGVLPLADEGISQHLFGRNLLIRASDPNVSPLFTEITDIRGRRLVRKKWNRDRSTEITISLPKEMAAGIYFVRHFLNQGKFRTARIILVD